MEKQLQNDEVQFLTPRAFCKGREGWPREKFGHYSLLFER